MFRQLVMPPGTTVTTPAVIDNINSLFAYHPLQISAIVETVWLNRMNPVNSQTSCPFVPWSPSFSNAILNISFIAGYDWTTSPPTAIPAPFTPVPPTAQPGILNSWSGTGPVPATLQPTNWDHLIYAYIVENTKIFQIFGKLLETYMFTKELEAPSQQSQLFWRNLEFLIFGDAMPSMIWTTSSRIRRDEIANRLNTYYSMFGIDVAHAAELAPNHPFIKASTANTEFIPVFEQFCIEIWRGTINSKNTSGANDTDPTVIASLARRLYDMLATSRQEGISQREEFRAVAVMSFIHLAVLYDSPIVLDLKATASSPEMRLQKMGERVGIPSHPRSKPFFDLAGPFSIMLQSIESGAFNESTGAQLLYQTPPTPISFNAESVIDQYTLSTGRDLKAQASSGNNRASAMAFAPPPRRPSQAPQLTGRYGNG